jgi:cytochrome c-type biogenesis protein
LALAGVAVLGLFFITRLVAGPVVGLSPDSELNGESAEVLEWRTVLDSLIRAGTLPAGNFPDVEALLAVPTYFEAAGSELPSEAADELSLLFYVSENAHDELDAEPPTPYLRVNGQGEIQLADTRVVATSPHHRMSMLRFRAADVAKISPTTENLELVFVREPDVGFMDMVLSWDLPIEFGSAFATSQVMVGPSAPGTEAESDSAGIAISGPTLTLAATLAVLGGVIASMWPCLFQLTAFFIPAMAGMSMEDARNEVPAAVRLKVVKAAFFFVLGFTIVYTAAGAMIGFAAQRVGESPAFMDWQRWLGIVGGTVILLLALRMAAKVRAPLVCKMPILSGMAQRKGTAKPWEMMVAGLAFATGCMTCFGAALVIAMVVYVGASGSAVIGALVLFLFSLGMGIPLVLAAMAMAKALPMLFKLEKIVPWMGLFSSLLMAGFALLLITGNYMVVSNRFFHFLTDAAVG